MPCPKNCRSCCLSRCLCNVSMKIENILPGNSVFYRWHTSHRNHADAILKTLVFNMKWRKKGRFSKVSEYSFGAFVRPDRKTSGRASSHYISSMFVQPAYGPSFRQPLLIWQNPVQRIPYRRRVKPQNRDRHSRRVP